MLEEALHLKGNFPLEEGALLLHEQAMSLQQHPHLQV